MNEAETTDLSKTLTQLEGARAEQLGESSYLATKCHALRVKALQDFTIEDLRIMIGQNLGLRFLVPLALARLEENPLAEGDYYPGDLLRNVLSLESAFWQTQADLRGRVALAGDRALQLIEAPGNSADDREVLTEAIRKFGSASPRKS